MPAAMTKRERIEATLAHQPVDRVPVLEQLSYNPRVIADWTGKKIADFQYTIDDICAVIRQTCDLAMPPVAPRGTSRVTSPDGFVTQHDNWTSWHVSRPFTDEHGARDWMESRIRSIRNKPFDAGQARQNYRRRILELQQKIGDTVILDYSCTGFCSIYDAMGLEIFTYFMAEYPELMHEHMEIAAANEVRRVHAVAERDLFPVILLPEDFATKQGPLFSPEFLHTYHYPYVRQLVNAWHEHGIDVIYHSDGNFRKAIPDLMACGVDGFYCLELNCGMEVVGLKHDWPQMTWAGSIDGVDLMEFGSPEMVCAEVRRQISETNALQTGGLIIASSSEINPPIPAANFRAMVEAAHNRINPAYSAPATGNA